MLCLIEWFPMISPPQVSFDSNLFNNICIAERCLAKFQIFSFMANDLEQYKPDFYFYNKGYFFSKIIVHYSLKLISYVFSVNEHKNIFILRLKSMNSFFLKKTTSLLNTFHYDSINQ